MKTQKGSRQTGRGEGRVGGIGWGRVRWCRMAGTGSGEGGTKQGLVPPGRPGLLQPQAPDKHTCSVRKL